jgi:hypothetical protein
MSDDLRKIARERARAVVEDGVWGKLSRKCQLGAIEEELRLMGVVPTGNEPNDDPRIANFVSEFKRLAAAEQTAVYLKIEQIWKASG